MPNHCETDVYIRGSDEDVKVFGKWLEEIEPLNRDICRALIPYPENFEQMDRELKAIYKLGGDERKAAETAYMTKYGQTGSFPKDGYNDGGYEWCCANWGTKWGTYDVDFTPHTKRGALLSFQSAWSPPSVAVFQALSEKFPDLTFEIEYFEGGAAYCGGMTFYAKSECEDYERVHGEPDNQWSGDYSGSRGG